MKPLDMILTAILTLAPVLGMAMQEDIDARFAHLVERARQEGQAFIAIIVDGDTGHILAEGINNSCQDPTQHSEIAAIRRLANAFPQADRQRLVMYTTAEPCPMCAAALVYSRLGRVHYGIDRDTLYARGWREFRLRAAQIFADANASGGLSVVGRQYQGQHLKACEDLFKPRG